MTKQKLIAWILSMILLVMAICPAVYAEAPAFVDLPPEGHWAHDPILWAYDEGITAGIDENHFGPHEQITRAQAVMMIWRMRNSVKPCETSTLPFVDVKPSAYYYTALLTAWENHWVGGVSEDQFDPDGICTRAQLVAILWHAFPPVPDSPVEEDQTPVKDVKDFVDVDENGYYYMGLWAFTYSGIIAGTDETHFSPNEPCTRDQFVTILYRIYNSGIFY